VAKWQGKGLQNPYHGFKSHRRLKLFKSQVAYHRGNQARVCKTLIMGSNPLRGQVSHRRLKLFKSQVAYHRGTQARVCKTLIMGSNPLRGQVSHRRLKLFKSQVSYHRGIGKIYHYRNFYQPRYPNNRSALRTTRIVLPSWKMIATPIPTKPVNEVITSAPITTRAITRF